MPAPTRTGGATSGSALDARRAGRYEATQANWRLDRQLLEEGALLSLGTLTLPVSALLRVPRLGRSSCGKRQDWVGDGVEPSASSDRGHLERGVLTIDVAYPAERVILQVGLERELHSSRAAVCGHPDDLNAHARQIDTIVDGERSLSVPGKII